jgi:4-amino-4-deoxy-L-arabinose transferase-like glycosyltransferase
MSEMPRFKLADALALLLILVTAAGVRVGYVWYLADQGRNAGPLQVQDSRPTFKALPEGGIVLTGAQPNELDMLAYQMKEKQSFASRAPLATQVEVTAHATPGYPGLLYLVEMAPIDAASMAPAVRWLQCALGSLTALCYFLFARRAFRSSLVGFLAGMLCAIHPFWIVNVAEIDDGVMASFVLALSLVLGARAGQGGGALTSLLYGLALAGLALTRATMLPFAFAAELWFLLRCRSLPRGWLYALLSFLGFANGLGAWTVRNYQQFQEVMPLIDSTHYHLWIGNHPDADGGPQTEEQMIKALAKGRDDVPNLLEQHLGEAKQPDRYNQLAADVFKQVRDDPAAAVQRRLRAGLDFFLGARWFQTQNPWERTTGGDKPDWFESYDVLVLSSTLLLILLFGALGWRWSYAWRWESLPASLAVFWIPLPYILSHAENLQGPRLPLDGVLLCYVALALICIIPVVGRPLLHGPAPASETDSTYGR